jgi:hypothetical protein
MKAGLPLQHSYPIHRRSWTAPPSQSGTDAISTGALHRRFLIHSSAVGSYPARCARFVPLSTCDEQASGRILGGMAAVENHTDVERLRDRIGELVQERQELRTAGADRESLERNRIQLVRRQSELGRALIQQHA